MEGGPQRARSSALLHRLARQSSDLDSVAEEGEQRDEPGAAFLAMQAGFLARQHKKPVHNKLVPGKGTAVTKPERSSLSFMSFSLFQQPAKKKPKEEKKKKNTVREIQAMASKEVDNLITLAHASASALCNNMDCSGAVPPNSAACQRDRWKGELMAPLLEARTKLADYADAELLQQLSNALAQQRVQNRESKEHTNAADFKILEARLLEQASALSAVRTMCIKRVELIKKSSNMTEMNLLTFNEALSKGSIQKTLQPLKSASGAARLVSPQDSDSSSTSSPAESRRPSAIATSAEELRGANHLSSARSTGQNVGGGVPLSPARLLSPSSGSSPSTSDYEDCSSSLRSPVWSGGSETHARGSSEGEDERLDDQGRPRRLTGMQAAKHLGTSDCNMSADVHPNSKLGGRVRSVGSLSGLETASQDRQLSLSPSCRERSPRSWRIGSGLFKKAGGEGVRTSRHSGGATGLREDGKRQSSGAVGLREDGLWGSLSKRSTGDAHVAVTGNEGIADAISVLQKTLPPILKWLGGGSTRWRWRRAFLLMKTDAVRIQTAYRRHRERKRYKDLKRVVLFCQQFWRQRNRALFLGKSLSTSWDVLQGMLPDADRGGSEPAALTASSVDLDAPSIQATRPPSLHLSSSSQSDIDLVPVNLGTKSPSFASKFSSPSFARKPLFEAMLHTLTAEGPISPVSEISREDGARSSGNLRAAAHLSLPTGVDEQSHGDKVPGMSDKLAEDAGMVTADGERRQGFSDLTLVPSTSAAERSSFDKKTFHLGEVKSLRSRARDAQQADAGKEVSVRPRKATARVVEQACTGPGIPGSEVSEVPRGGSVGRGLRRVASSTGRAGVRSGGKWSTDSQLTLALSREHKVPMGLTAPTVKLKGSLKEMPGAEGVGRGLRGREPRSRNGLSAVDQKGAHRGAGDGRVPRRSEGPARILRKGRSVLEGGEEKQAEVEGEEVAVVAWDMGAAMARLRWPDRQRDADFYSRPQPKAGGGSLPRRRPRHGRREPKEGNAVEGQSSVSQSTSKSAREGQGTSRDWDKSMHASVSMDKMKHLAEEPPQQIYGSEGDKPQVSVQDRIRQHEQLSPRWKGNTALRRQHEQMSPRWKENSTLRDFADTNDMVIVREAAPESMSRLQEDEESDFFFDSRETMTPQAQTPLAQTGTRRLFAMEDLGHRIGIGE